MNVEVCLTPELIHQHDLKAKRVVVVDIFRATSCMVAGLHHGVTRIKPVATIEECLAHGEMGYIMAGERGGKMVEGFDMGNSPFDYQSEDVIGRKVCISTTNGSKTLLRSLEAEKIVIGSFLNLRTTAYHLQQNDTPIVIHCAGWKGTPNLEDTLFAGALLEALDAMPINDSALMAHQLFLANQDNMLDLAWKSSHAQRLAGFGVKEDIRFCMDLDRFSEVVTYEDEHVILASHL